MPEWQFLNNLEHLRSGCAQSCGWLQRSRGHALIRFTVDNYAGLHDERMAAVCRLSSVALGLLLWYLHREPLQQIAVFIPLLIGVGVGTYLAQGGNPESDNSSWQGCSRLDYEPGVVWAGVVRSDSARHACHSTRCNRGVVRGNDVC